MSKRNRRIGDGKKRRRRLLVLACLGSLGIGGAYVARSLPSGGPAPEALPSEEAPEARAPEPPSGPRILPASVIARSALEGHELPEGEIVEDLPTDAFFVLEAEVPLPDLRLRLFDEGHRLVPAEEFIELGRGTRYLLQPKEALRAGARYTLIADGQESAQPSDVSGQAYLPARYTLTVLDG